MFVKAKTHFSGLVVLKQVKSYSSSSSDGEISHKSPNFANQTWRDVKLEIDSGKFCLEFPHSKVRLLQWVFSPTKSEIAMATITPTWIDDLLPGGKSL